MRISEVIRWARRELGALVRLSPWIVASLLLAAGIWRTDLSATSGLFQSPPTATTLPPRSTPTPTQSPTVAPTDTPVSTTEPSATPEPTTLPTEIPATATEVPVEPTEAPATETPAPVAPAGVQATDTPAPTATEERGEQEVEPDSEAQSPEDPNLEFDWGELFDALALGASYLWLGCGILLVLLLPFLFIALWVASNRRKQQEE